MVSCYTFALITYLLNKGSLRDYSGLRFIFLGFCKANPRMALGCGGGLAHWICFVFLRTLINEVGFVPMLWKGNIDPPTGAFCWFLSI